MTTDEAADRLAKVAGHALSDSDLALLIDCLGHRRKSVQRRAAELLASGASTGPVQAALSAALSDASLARRWGAAYAWSLIGPPPPAALPVFLEVMGAADGDLRWAAATILAGVGPAVVPDVLRLVTQGNDAQRKMALYCLRDLRVISNAAADAALAALSDAEIAVRLAALTVLPDLVPDRHAAVAGVLRLIHDPIPGVRRAAVTVLGDLGQSTPEVVAVLRGAAKSDDAAHRRAAERALRLLAIVDRG
ncbi:MAG TPA: HEAT repeat domain-containing protein [Candidatus Binatia bacterium]|nr:HEAT repeat domain-containing protein [Candidatus Binatia bacterium]